MIVLAGLALGALHGALRARARRGSGFDIAWYALVHAILFAIAGMFLTIAIDRLA